MVCVTFPSPCMCILKPSIHCLHSSPVHITTSLHSGGHCVKFGTTTKLSLHSCPPLSTHLHAFSSAKLQTTTHHSIWVWHEHVEKNSTPSLHSSLSKFTGHALQRPSSEIKTTEEFVTIQVLCIMSVQLCHTISQK